MTSSLRTISPSSDKYSTSFYVMYQGRIVESGATDLVLSNPTGAYTIALLQSVPRSEGDWLVAREH